MNWFICQEFDELFWMEAKNLRDAKQKAALFNAVVIREATEEELFESGIRSNSHETKPQRA